MAKVFEGTPGMGTLLFVKHAGKDNMLLEGPMRLADGSKARIFAQGNPKSGYQAQIKRIVEEGQTWPTIDEFKIKPFAKERKQLIETENLGRLIVFPGTTVKNESCIRVNQRGAIKL